jgi:pimeloyl-ACP methyl ester carboxylesterase
VVATFESQAVDVGEVTLHVVTAGQRGRPLVLLLHGFPEFWWSWRHQLGALAEAGFFVVAPDLRGFHRSEKPRSVSAYRVGRLEADVAGLIRAFGAERASIVGHDWGGVIAYFFAARHPELITRLCILNAPHPAEFARRLASPKQLLRSWYVFFFQLPSLPERWLGAHDYARLAGTFLRDGLERETAARYVEAARTAGDRLRGGINYYRASVRDILRRTSADVPPIRTPTLVIWGDGDNYLAPELARPRSELVPNARVEFVPNGTHWVQQVAPARVNELLLGFLCAPNAASDQALLSPS